MCSRRAGSTRVFNAGNGKSIAIHEIVQEILRRTDSKSEIRFEPVGAGDIPSLDIGFLETHGRRMKTRFDDPARLRACQEGRGDSELLPSIWRFRLA